MTVTVVVPTIPSRHDLFLQALNSVGNQTVRDVQVFAMSDGPDPDLAGIIADSQYPGVRRIYADCGLRVIPLGRQWHPPGWGAAQRLVAGYLCETEFMAYLDDDNIWEPEHLEVLLAAVEGHDFAFSQGLWPSGQVVGDAPEMGHIDTSLILHRTELLRKSTWDPADDYIADGRVVERWVAAGATWACVPRQTLIYRHRGH